MFLAIKLVKGHEQMSLNKLLLIFLLSSLSLHLFFSFFVKMVKIKVTERIEQFIDEAIGSNHIGSDADVLRASKEEGGIEIAVLDRVCRKLREKNPTKKIWLHELTKGSKAYFPAKVAPARVRINQLLKIFFSVYSDIRMAFYRAITF